MRQAQSDAQSRFAAALAQAQALDAKGKEAECLQATSRAKQILELD